MAQLVMAAALDGAPPAPSTSGNPAAKAIADQLVSTYADNPAALAELKQQASLLLQVLGPPSPAATGPTAPVAPTPDPAAAPNISPTSPPPLAGAATGGITASDASALQAALQQLAQALQTGQQPTAASVPSVPSIPLPPPVAAAAAVPAATSAPGVLAQLPIDLGGELLNGGLLGALERAAAPATGGTASPVGAAAAASANQTIRAAEGPSIANAFYPIGSGDNILEFRKRVQAVKEYYDEARTYLHIDDAVRIQGYINTLESLGISFLAAFPVAEVAYFIALGALGAALFSLIASIFFTAASAVSIAQFILALQSAIDAQAAAALSFSTSPAPAPTASTSDRAATSSSSANSSSSSNSFSSASAAEAAQLSSLLKGNPNLVNNVINAAAPLDVQLLSFALSPQALGPLNLGAKILTAASGSLQRLQSYNGPVAAAVSTLVNDAQTTSSTASSATSSGK